MSHTTAPVKPCSGLQCQLRLPGRRAVAVSKSGEDPVGSQLAILRFRETLIDYRVDFVQPPTALF